MIKTFVNSVFKQTSQYLNASIQPVRGRSYFRRFGYEYTNTFKGG